MLRDQIHDLTEDSQHKQTPAPVKLEQPKPLKALHYEGVRPILQFFEETDPVKKQQREKDMMSLTLRSIATPASTNAGGAKRLNRKSSKPNVYDIFPTGGQAMMNSDSGSYQLVSGGLEHHSRAKLLDNLSDAAMRKALSEHANQQVNIKSPKFNTQVEFEYRPSYIK